MQNLLKTLILATMTLSLMACGKSFQTTNDLAASSGLNQGLGTVPGGNDPAAPAAKTWSDVSNGANAQTDDTVSNPLYSVSSATPVIQILPDQQAIELLMPLPASFNLPFQIANMPVPQLPGVSIQQIVNSDGSTSIGVIVPLKYLIKGTTLSPYGALPNGDPIPFIPAGEAHGFAIDLPQNAHYRLHIYFTAGAAAAFVETPDLKIPDQYSGFIPTIGFPVKNQAKTAIVGYLAFVPNRLTYSSGIYVASKIPNDVAILIDNLLRY